MACCCRLVLAGHASGQHSWRGQGGTSCRKSGDTAAVWAPCCGSSTCRWDKCPSARRCLAASASRPRLANFPPRFPRLWQCRRCRIFRHFHPFFLSAATPGDQSIQRCDWKQRIAYKCPDLTSQIGNITANIMHYNIKDTPFILQDGLLSATAALVEVWFFPFRELN